MMDTSFRTLIGAGKVARRAGQRENCLHLFGEAVLVARAANDADWLCEALYFLGHCRHFFDDDEGAMPPLIEAISLRDSVADVQFVASAPTVSARAAPVAEPSVPRQTLEVGAECVSSARSDLCGGWSAMN
jgi:hypothetical protein